MGPEVTDESWEKTLRLWTHPTQITSSPKTSTDSYCEHILTRAQTSSRATEIMMRGTSLRDDGVFRNMALVTMGLANFALFLQMKKSFPRCLSFPRRRKPVALQGVRRLWSLFWLLTAAKVSFVCAFVPTLLFRWHLTNSTETLLIWVICKNWSTTRVCAAWTCLAGVEYNRCFFFMLRSCTAGLTSCWQRETLLFHSPELCLSSRGWEGLKRERVWAWLLCQEIEAIPVAGSDSGAQGDNKEWHPTCANSPAVSLLQCSHPADIIAQGRHMLQRLCLANLSNYLLLQNLVRAHSLCHKPLPVVRIVCWNFA